MHNCPPRCEELGAGMKSCQGPCMQVTVTEYALPGPCTACQHNAVTGTPR